MNAIRSVFAAFTNLAASLNALAGVVDAATGRLRQQLAEGDAAPISEADSTPAKGRNGRVKSPA